MQLTGLMAVALLSQQVAAFYPYVPEYPCLESPCPTTSRRALRDQSELHDAPVEDSLVIKIKQRVPQDDLPLPVQVARYAERLVHRFAHSSTSKRANNYNIVASKTPTQADSAAMDQDGTDFSYFATVYVGSNSVPLHMLMDTGASTSWVMSSTCASEACVVHNTFDASKSKSYSSTGKLFSVSYGSGSVSGTVMTDSITLAGFTFPFIMGLANITSSEFKNFPLDGIMGLAQSSSTDTPSFLSTLAATKKLKNNLFGINLSRAADGLNDGAINFGAPDTSKYTGSLSYTPIVSAGGSWNIPMDDAGYNGKMAGIKGKNVIIDTGTSYCFVGPTDAATLHTPIPGAVLSADKAFWSVPCTTTSPLQFVFSGVTYSVSYKDWVGGKVTDTMCMSNIYPRSVTQSGEWLFGDVFLKNVYSVFDVDQNRIGFGIKNAAPAASTAISATSTKSGEMTSSIQPSTSSTPASTSAASAIPAPASSATVISAANSSPGSSASNAASGTPSNAAGSSTSSSATTLLTGVSGGFNGAISPPSATASSSASVPTAAAPAVAAATPANPQGAASRAEGTLISLFACVALTIAILC